MRIISGKFKGRSIEYLSNLNTRPLKDSVRENIFNILSHSKKIKVEIENSNILDLYSGIGSFGIESISRGAKKVTFVDQDTIASNILKNNLTKLSINSEARIVNDKIENFLNKPFKDKFNIFFFDPPFTDMKFAYNLELIKKKEIYTDQHLVVIHREKKTNDILKNLINILEIKEYGRSKIIFGLFF